MEQLASFSHLGGYGVYIWPAYGVAAAVLIGLLWWTVRGLRANERLLARLQPPPNAVPRSGSPRRDTAR